MPHEVQRSGLGSEQASSVGNEPRGVRRSACFLSWIPSCPCGEGSAYGESGWLRGRFLCDGGCAGARASGSSCQYTLAENRSERGHSHRSRKGQTTARKLGRLRIPGRCEEQLPWPQVSIAVGARAPPSESTRPRLRVKPKWAGRCHRGRPCRPCPSYLCRPGHLRHLHGATPRTTHVRLVGIQPWNGL